MSDLPHCTNCDRLREEKDGLWRDREAFVEREARLREENETLAKDAAQVVGEYIEDLARLRALLATTRAGDPYVQELLAELARLREGMNDNADAARDWEREVDRLREEADNLEADRDQLAFILKECQKEQARLREKYESAKAMYNGPLKAENATLREARDAWVKERAGHCREIARLREALEETDRLAMMAGGGTGWGPLAAIHDIARNALKETT